MDAFAFLPSRRTPDSRAPHPQEPSSSATPATATRRRLLGPALWTVQALLALFFAYAGGTKLASSADALAEAIPWTAGHATLDLVTGWADLLGGLGILLPSLLRIAPGLGPEAATGQVALQLLAAKFHLARDEGAVVPLNLVLVALAAFVLWGRARAMPVIARRGRVAPGLPFVHRVPHNAGTGPPSPRRPPSRGHGMTDLSHLSALDGAFLHFESPEMPMHVGSLALFDPPPPENGP